jgi:hypothetical protein
LNKGVKMSEGNLRSDDNRRDIASAADWFDMHDLDISGEAGDHVVGGYLVVTDWKTGQLCKGFHNHGSSVATIIVKTAQGGVDVPIRLDAGGFSGKLPAITHIKVAGTSDDLTVFCQKVG